VALQAQVGIHWLQVALVILLGAEGQRDAGGERNGADRQPLGELGSVVAGDAFEAVAGRLRYDAGQLDAGLGDDLRAVVGKEDRQAGGAVALGARGWHDARIVPIAERHGVAGEVPGVIAVHLGHVDLGGKLGVQVGG